MTDRLENVFTNDYWNKRWAKDDIAWHRTYVNERLMKFSDELLFKSSSDLKVFLPLCGKSWDLKWLYDKGCHVIGVDCAMQALEDFVKEQNIPYSRKTIGETEVIESDDKRLVLWNCDLFDFPNISGEKDFDAVWDRGSFVAINYDEREKYVELMQSMLAPNFRYLLEWYHYDGSKYGGPPKTSTEDEIEHRFGKYFASKIAFKDAIEFPKYEGGEAILYASIFSPKD